MRMRYQTTRHHITLLRCQIRSTGNTTSSRQHKERQVPLTVCIVVVVLCVLLSYVYSLYCVGIAFFFFTLDAGLLALSQYSEGPATGHLDRDFSWFPCA